MQHPRHHRAEKITERKRAEEALRTSQLMLGDIYQRPARAGVLEGQESGFSGLQHRLRARRGICRSEGHHRQR